MNQFKKAKQLRIESGQTTESITDLKTVGVAQNKEAVSKIATSDTIIDDTINKNQDDETQVKDISKTDSKISINSSDRTSIKPDLDRSISSYKKVDDLEIKKRNTIEHDDLDPMVISERQTTKEQNIYPEVMFDTQSTIKNIGSMINDDASMVRSISDDIDNMVRPENKYNNIDLPVQESTMIVSERVQDTLMTPQKYTDIIPSQTNIKSHSSDRTQDIKYRDTSTVRQNKSAKKSAPNIFTPKGEAKSMRKSLVLKPTSVKIAEDYCSKNGGSFNELIQTLLDNFINEYGL